MEEDFYTHRRSNFTFILLLAVNIFLLSAHLTGSVHGLKNFLFYVLSPGPAAAAQVIQFGQDLSGNIREIVRIHQENVRLKRDIERYSYLEEEYRRAFEENTRLRQLAGFRTYGTKKAVIARIIMREPGSWFQWVTIDKGSADGIPIDAPVLAWANDRLAVLGRVGEVFAHSAKVVLITSALSALPVKIKSTDEDGLLEGQDNPRLMINYLLPDKNVLIGDEVVTSPLSSVFPPNIPVGRVLDLGSADTDAYRSVIVRSAINVNGLREAMVLIPESKNNQ